MKFNIKSLLKDKNVLYIVMFLAVANMLGYLVLRDFEVILFFLLVGFLTTYFSKNMIIVLVVAMVASGLFKVTSQPRSNFEGFREKDPSPSPSMHPSPATDPSNNKVSFTNKLKPKQLKTKVSDDSEEDEEMGKKRTLDQAELVVKEDQELRKEAPEKKLEASYDQLNQTLNMDPKELGQIQAQQAQLLESLKAMEPMMNTAKEMLTTMEGMGIDLNSTFEQFGGSNAIMEKLNTMSGLTNVTK